MCSTVEAVIWYYIRYKYRKSLIKELTRYAAAGHRQADCSATGTMLLSALDAACGICSMWMDGNLVSAMNVFYL